MSCRNVHSPKIIIICLVIFCKEIATQEIGGADNLNFEKYPNYGTDWIYFPDGNGDLQVLSLTNELDLKGHHLLKDGANTANRIFGSTNVDKDVTFTLYTINNNETGQRVFPNKDSISKSGFEPSKPTKFCTHGWLSSGKSETCLGIKNEYLIKSDYNIFVVDWSPIASSYNYFTPMSNTKNIGQYFANFLDKLIQFGAQTRDIHLIGHSLGAHISAFAGEAVKAGTICRVTGLDPAQPGFNQGILPGGKLSKNSANFVDVIHTCGGALGLSEKLGHADFYPNGGSFSQPGCGDMNGVMQGCSHGRAWQYFKESINGQPFMARNCPSYNAFLADKCPDDFTLMGDGANHTASGNYYLQTASRSPYARLST